MSDKQTTVHRILIVDDNTSIHADFRKVLAPEEAGSEALRETASRLFARPAQARDPIRFELTCTRRGQEDLELLRASTRAGEPFVLAFVDVRMPDGWDGIETVQQFWRSNPNLQVVICTAYSDFSWREIRERLGRSDRLLLLKKPFDALEVRQLTYSLCDRARTEEQLRLSSRDLAEKAHLAGMAEVATAVLHNVGNVLNSLNVSTSLLREKIEHSRLESLRCVSDLAAERRLELERVFQDNPRARLLPDLLEAVCDALETERGAQLTDLDNIVRNVGRIRDVIQVQESYASASAVREVTRPETLLDDALQLCRTDLELLGVRIVQEIAPDLPCVLVDRQAVLEILITALHNAREAMQTREAAKHVLTLRATAALMGGVRFSIQDTGAGIVPEDLPQLFAYGFSTKGSNHGFALHRALLAARKMGGDLHLESPGAGLGATCSLDLPTTTEQTRKPLP